MRAHFTRARPLHAVTLLALLALAGCGTTPKQSSTPSKIPSAATPARQDPVLPVLPPAGSGRGGYYKDDGPGDNPPANLRDVPDAEVRKEAYSTRGNRPYVVFGKTYTPMTGNQPFSERGTGTWYGKKFHGQRTSSGELYDMYKMSAAHPTLPIPSYARVTSLDSGRQVIVRINDRGPFHPGRVIDVSYTAALKLGFLGKGSHQVLVERLLPADIDAILAARQAPKPAPVPLAVVPLAPAAPLAAASAMAATDETPLTGAVLQPETAPVLLPVSAPASVSSPLGLNAPPLPAAAGSGFYLQLGAFSRAENAEAVRSRLQSYADRLGNLEVVQAGAVHRLFGGPFQSRADALQAAQGLPDGLSLKPIVVQR